jgi:selenocysteine-specific elongation factor
VNVVKRAVVFGTAGHIDHGKTALVHALTGIDTDRLPEEKRRGITIDLGFASMEMVFEDGSPLQLSFIDVPGHKLFVRNMLAGTGCIDAVMLVISADEGVKPQTEEHLAICGLLGITRGLVVVTKRDAVSADQLENVFAEARGLLKGSALSGARILSASARTGIGIEEVQRELLRVGQQIPLHDPDRLTRLPLDRAFVMKGFGTVVTGTLLSGALKNGQPVSLEPGNRPGRIRGIQTHGRSTEMANAGSRVALNIAGIDVADAHRGHTVIVPNTLAAMSVIDVEVNLLPYAPELKHRARVHFHAFTSDTLASVSIYGYQSAEAGSSRLMRLRLRNPVLLLPGDRFVLRQCSPARTIGGGKVVDAHPMAKLRKATCLAWLESINHASEEEKLLLRVSRRNSAGISLGDLSAETGFTTAAIERMLMPLISSNVLVRVADDLFVSTEAVVASMDLMKKTLVGRFNAMARSGVKRSELRSATELNGGVFDLAIERLSQQREVVLRGESVYPRGCESEYSVEDQKKMSAIADIYREAGLASPSTSEVGSRLSLNEREMHRLITFLLREKAIVRMGNDSVYIHRTALELLKQQVASLKGETMDVARFKSFTGLSRKYAIPLLEYLDREHLTRKQGDSRLVL